MTALYFEEVFVLAPLVAALLLCEWKRVSTYFKIRRNTNPTEHDQIKYNRLRFIGETIAGIIFLYFVVRYLLLDF